MDPAVIPSQLRGRLFVKVRPSTKEAFESFNVTECKCVYRYDNPDFQEFLRQGGNVGVTAGFNHAVLDADDSELVEYVRRSLPLTLEIRTGRGGVQFHYNCENNGKTIPLFQLVNGTRENLGHCKLGNSYGLVPPSVHPNGHPYLVENDRPVATITERGLREVLAPWIVQRVQSSQKQAGEFSDSEFSVRDLISGLGLKQNGDSYTGSHPVHGSSTGANFHVTPSKNVWHCFRCCTGGGPWQLFAVLERLVECQDSVPGALRGELFTRVKERAIEKGLVKPEEKKKLRKKGEKKQDEPVLPLMEMAALPDWEGDSRISVTLRLDKDQSGQRLVQYYRVYANSPEIVGEPLDRSKFLTDTAPSQKLLDSAHHDLTDIHAGLKTKLDKHLYLVNEIEYELVVLGAESTFFREVFDSYPYFDFLSIENGCGKTTAMKCLVWSSYYGFLTMDPTSPILFRMIEDTHGTVGIDQVDELFRNTKQNRDILTLLDSGHTRGIPAYRMNMDVSPPEPVAYDPFGLKAFTRTGWIPPDLLSRCITVKMVQNKGFKMVDSPPKPEDLGPYRDRLYLYRLYHYEQVEATYKQLQGEAKLSGRVRDLFLPLLTMARLNSKELYNRVLDYAEKEEERRSVVKRDERVINFVEYLVENSLVGETPVKNIRDVMEARLRNAGLLSEHKPLTSQTVIGWLEALGCSRSPKRAQNLVHYAITKEVLDRLGAIYMSHTSQQKLEDGKKEKDTLSKEPNQANQANRPIENNRLGLLGKLASGGEGASPFGASNPVPAPSIYDRVRAKLASKPGPLSWDYAIELAEKAIGDRKNAERALNRLKEDGVLAQDPDGYWRFTR